MIILYKYCIKYTWFSYEKHSIYKRDYNSATGDFCDIVPSSDILLASFAGSTR